MVRSWQGYYRLVRERPRCIVHIWARCRIAVLTKARHGFNLQSASGMYSVNTSIMSTAHQTGARPLFAFLSLLDFHPPFNVCALEILLKRWFSRSSRTVMNSLQNDTWSHFSPRRITVENSITRVPWWALMRLYCAPSKYVGIPCFHFGR